MTQLEDTCTHCKSALVVMSGGQDSATCLLWALDRFAHVRAIAFDYGQRHRVELACARTLCERWGVSLEVVETPSLAHVARANALTSDEPIDDGGGERIPSTFVPGRNLMFLTLAASFATRHNISTIVVGVCQADFSGYPDCREDTMRALELALRLGLDEDRLAIETPLMWLTKAETWALSDVCAGSRGVDDIIWHTHTCYAGDHATRHAWGYGCGDCPACNLRASGWREWQASREEGERDD